VWARPVSPFPWRSAGRGPLIVLSLFTWSSYENITFGFPEGRNRIKLVSIRQRKKRKTFLQTMSPKLRASAGLAFIGLPEGEEVFICLCLIWPPPPPSIIYYQRNMGTIRRLTIPFHQTSLSLWAQPCFLRDVCVENDSEAPWMIKHPKILTYIDTVKLTENQFP